jgi:hypothetical protein
MIVNADGSFFATWLADTEMGIKTVTPKKLQKANSLKAITRN